MMKKSLGFTLGEILITLAVIGVVASLVLPQLINGQKAGTAKAQFDTAYSLMAKAISDMDADNVSVEPASYAAAGGFYTKFKEYNKLTIDCGKYSNTNTSVCISTASSSTDESYKTLSGKKMNNGNANHVLDDGAFVLNNGMLVMVENPNNNYNGLLISVDINGKNKNPNRWGYDLFTFELVKGGQLLPVGAPGTGQASTAIKNWGKNNNANIADYCKEGSNETFNGITCSYYAATEPEYFQKLYKGH